MAAKKKTAKPDAELAALKRANAALARRLDKRTAELTTALDHQAASAEILRAIANTSGDAERSLQQIAEITARLFDAPSVTIRIAGESEWVRTIRVGASSQRIGAVPAAQLQLGGRNLPATVFQENRQIHIPDLDNIDPSMADWPVVAARADGTRTICGTPLRREGKPIGALVIYRNKLVPFTAEELALQQSFADQAVIAIENARLFNETREALERQTATAEILKVIASSPSDVQPVFEAIAESAKRLLGGHSALVTRVVDDMIHLAAFTTGNEAGSKALQTAFPSPLSSPHRIHSRVARIGQPAFHSDFETDLDVLSDIKEVARARGYRSIVVVPMLREGISIGTIGVTRREPGPFSSNHIDLLKTFADQAVIAIENARLFNETKEALERQTATAEILKVIASSPSDVQPVFDAIATSAKRLIGGFSTTVWRFIDDVCHLAAFTPTSPAADDVLKANFPLPLADFVRPFELVLKGEAVQIADTETVSDPRLRDVARLRGFRSMSFTPLMSDGSPIGLISVTRTEPGSFPAHHIQLVQTFADQAVIAIENVRLFNEVQAKTNDLSESLQQQTATADVLKVISRSAFDLQTVLDTLVESAARLCEADEGTIFQPRDGTYRLVASCGLSPAKQEFLQSRWFMPGQDTTVGRVLSEGKIVHLHDFQADPNYALSGDPDPVRTRLGIPLLREGSPIGVFVLTRREARPFSEQQLELVQTFADQAVIAIENVRLFEEVQARTRDLTEALEQQIATSEVLGVISSSAGDLSPVFDAMLSNAMKLCGANFGVLNTFDGKQFQTAATHGLPPAYDEFRRRQLLDYGPGTAPARLLQGELFVELVDLVDTDAYRSGEPNRRALVDLGGARSLLAVPLLKDERVVGNILIFRQEQRPFLENQIMLLQQFAAQAVIAIENTRLITELHQRTDDLSETLTYQTGSSNILKVIASSPTDVGPVLRAIADSACELCEAHDAIVHLREGDHLRYRAHNGPIPFGFEKLPTGEGPMPFGIEKLPINRNWVTGRSVVDKVPIHVHDVLSAEGNDFPEAQRLSRREGTRTILSVPLLREGESIGAIVLRRTEVNPFSEKQIALLQTFADQAVIAIGNVRLFEQVQERTQELSQSLDDLRTAQDRLVQTEKLASLGQLTAGIAHEIKNPLNFVNNFSALSAELVDELNDALKPVGLDGKTRQEVGDLTQLLKDNLQKVVQHGKRADSIVKNMLLHSREGSGEHRPTDINALLDESLNLAYHGARAEKSEFNITLQRDFDEKAGMIELFPQEITRAFLNLISNGFYAAAKRKTETGNSGFEPALRATTKNMGNSVEIRIRDNGTGIPAEVKEKMFNPFFTTKPAGEGTGLGLSMSHDIIVKQHGGMIDVATEPGQFTEFTILLPRTSNPQENKQDKKRG